MTYQNTHREEKGTHCHRNIRWFQFPFKITRWRRVQLGRIPRYFHHSFHDFNKEGKATTHSKRGEMLAKTHYSLELGGTLATTSYFEKQKG